MFAGAFIAAKELLPIIVATTIWGPQWVGASVLCHCDNEAVVAAVRVVTIETQPWPICYGVSSSWRQSSTFR